MPGMRSARTEAGGDRGSPPHRFEGANSRWAFPRVSTGIWQTLVNSTSAVFAEPTGSGRVPTWLECTHSSRPNWQGRWIVPGRRGCLMEPPIPPITFALLLFVGMLLMLELGRRFAARQQPGGAGDGVSNLGTLETAVFALFGLLIAFTFSGAAARFQDKRMLIADEANAIWNAYQRIDLVAPQAQPDLRLLLREYVGSRLEIYRRLPNMRAAGEEIAKAKRLQSEIWAATIAATRLPSEDPAAARMLITAVEDMIRMNRTRMISLQNHPPPIVHLLLFFLGLLSSLLAGFRMASSLQRSWLHMISFALMTAIVVCVTIDVEYPRVGLIRLDDADQVLAEVRASMH